MDSLSQASVKTPVIRRQDYTVFIENYQGLSFVHCDCYKWTKDTKKQLLEDWEKLVSIHGEPIYAIHEIDDNKHLKFITLFGFSFNNSFLGSDGKERQLFVRK